MTITEQLKDRSTSCELCTSTEDLQAVHLSTGEDQDISQYVLCCGTCAAYYQSPKEIDESHWRGLSDAIWNETSSVKVLSWLILDKLQSLDWARDLKEMMYLTPEEESWAQSLAVQSQNAMIHKDSNGEVLQTGDNVILIKDLKVKGANFTAKRGTAVRRIRVDPDNATYIEGKVNGQNIVIITDYVKKSS